MPESINIFVLFHSNARLTFARARAFETRAELRDIAGRLNTGVEKLGIDGDEKGLSTLSGTARIETSIDVVEEI